MLLTQLPLPIHTHRSKTERRKNFISNQVDDCKDLSGLYYLLPFQKGYLINWDTQRQIWDYVFGQNVLNIKTCNYSLLVTEPIFNFTSIQENMDEIFFEDYKFQALTRLPSSTLSSYNYSHTHSNTRCTLVVDSGYSFTHIVPHFRNKMIPNATLRIDAGGKLLTNYLKETVSYRQLHVLDETYVMNQVKEDVCYVSMNFQKEMLSTHERGNSISCEYVLPNFSHHRRGYVKDREDKTKNTDEQSLVLSVERIATPEILFYPSDIGVEQMGIPEAIVHSISLTPKEMHPHLYSNIVFMGGNAMFRGFKARVEDEVRKLAPSDYTVCVTVCDDPITYSWFGGKVVADETSDVEPVTSAEYKEFGQNICRKKFGEQMTWCPDV